MDDLVYSLVTGADIISLYLIIVSLFLRETGKRGSQMVLSVSVAIKVLNLFVVLVKHYWNIITLVATVIYVLFLTVVFVVYRRYDSGKE